jgi:hypothetical protein
VGPNPFRTVILNRRGWAALVLTGCVVGAVPGWLVSGRADAAVLGFVVGVMVVVGAALAADAVRDHRTLSSVAVADAAGARARLLAGGISVLGSSEALVGGRTVHYVTVRQRDAVRAERMVGLPTDSRRARRRWKSARMAATGDPTIGRC